MKKSFLAVVFLGFLFTLGCGAGPGIHGIGPGGGGGTFSNASLNGSYVYQINGIDFSSGANVVYNEAGVFTADGKGNITGGIDDFTEGTGSTLGSATSGTYTINSDGTGNLILNETGSTENLAVTIAGSSKVYLVEEDAANAAGIAELQSASAIAAAPTGTYVFKLHTTSGQGVSTAAVGQLTISAGIFQSGGVDVNQGGTASSPSLTNFTFNAPIADGRGTGTLTESSGTVSSFMYYIVDGNNLRLLSTDTSSGTGGYGRAEMQSGAPFSAASLSGNYVFSSKGDDSSGIDSVNTIGVFDASGGTISSGAYDSVEDLNPFSDVAITGGTYSVTPSGRATVTIVSTKTVNEVLWMVSPSRAFFVTASDTSDLSDVEDGTADLQQSGAFSNASINGQFGFDMDGFSTNAGDFIDRTGTLQWDGNGNLSLNEFESDSGSGSAPGVLTGNYTVAANGRATGNINGLSVNPSDLVFYFISDTQGYVLQEDSGTELIGEMTHQ